MASERGIMKGRSLPRARVGQAVSSPPSSNTGGTCGIDYLSVVFGEDFETPQGLCEILTAHASQRFELRMRDKGLYGYRESAELHVDAPEGESIKCGVIAWGGDATRNTVYLSLTGVGCQFIEAWDGLAGVLGGIGHGKITRVDHCVDFLDGEYTVDQAIADYDAGLFQSKYSPLPPKRSLFDDFGSGDGRTFYVGKRENGKMARIYEKGKQLGDKLSQWVRFEVEVRNIDRVIPWAAVSNPAAYFAGHYEACANLVAVAAERIRCVVAAARKSADRTLAALRISYGKFINVLVKDCGWKPWEVLRRITREGAPADLRAALLNDRRVLAIGAPF